MGSGGRMMKMRVALEVRFGPDEWAAPDEAPVTPRSELPRPPSLARAADADAQVRATIIMSATFRNSNKQVTREGRKQPFRLE
jgi:hypothetical protein